tara:strand:+ start:357 stop:1334 length:978 start_codon:yes stop_codon:yes gene_type:complete
MDILNASIVKNRNLKMITLKNYNRIYSRLMKEIGISNVEIFLDSNVKVLKLIKTKKISSQATLLSAMIVALESYSLEHEPDYSPAIVLYRDYMKSILPIIEKAKYAQIKNETQDTNWTSWGELQNCNKSNRKAITRNIKRTDLNNTDLRAIQLWVVSNLYTVSDENPPRRLDYKNIKIIKKKDFEKKHEPEQNYLIIQSAAKKYLYFADFKTVKSTGIISIPVGDALNKVLNEYLKILKNNSVKNDYLLFNNQGKAIGEQMNVLIGEAFACSGKSVTVNLIRHIYLSENADKWSLAKRKDISRLMSHSLETQLTYSKVGPTPVSP